MTDCKDCASLISLCSSCLFHHASYSAGQSCHVGFQNPLITTQEKKNHLSVRCYSYEANFLTQHLFGHAASLLFQSSIFKL